MQFLDLLRQSPQMLEELDKLVTELAEAGAQTGLPGELAFTLKFLPHGNEMHVEPKIRQKTPRAPVGTIVVALSPDGRLSRSKQTEILFRQQDLH